MKSLTLLTHNKLVLLGLRWLKNRCTIAFSEFATMANETPDVIGWKSGQSFLIECKASKSDYANDKRKIVRRYPQMGMGQRRYILCPARMIDIADLPPKWGLLWATENRIIERCGAGIFAEIDHRSEIIFLVSMLRRVQIRIGKQSLSKWLRFENMDGE